MIKEIRRTKVKFALYIEGHVKALELVAYMRIEKKDSIIVSFDIKKEKVSICHLGFNEHKTYITQNFVYFL